jgi:hypothetical protein
MRRIANLTALCAAVAALATPAAAQAPPACIPLASIEAFADLDSRSMRIVTRDARYRVTFHEACRTAWPRSRLLVAPLHYGVCLAPGIVFPASPGPPCVVASVTALPRR